MSETKCNCPHCGGEIILQAVKPLPHLVGSYAAYERNQLLGFPMTRVHANYIPPPPVLLKVNEWGPGWKQQLYPDWSRLEHNQPFRTPTRVYGPTSVSKDKEEGGELPTGTGSGKGNTETAHSGPTAELRLPNAEAGKEAAPKTKKEGM
jgi:hypothetical protein